MASPTIGTHGVTTSVTARKRRLRVSKRFAQIVPYIGLLAAFVFIALFPQFVAPMSPVTNHLLDRLSPIHTVGGHHVFWLGSDDLGRDVLSRLIYGAQVSLITAVSSVAVSGIVGGTLGIIAGFRQGAVGDAIMRVADIMLAIPFLLLAILIVSVLGPSLRSLIFALIITRWPVYARMANATAIKTKELEFIRAAEAVGASAWRITTRHVAPYVVSSLVVVATLEVATMIMYEAGMSFLGLGVQPPTPSWGSMLAESENYITTAWWMITFPGIALFLVVLSVNRVGDYLQGVLNPERHRGR